MEDHHGHAHHDHDSDGSQHIHVHDTQGHQHTHGPGGHTHDHGGGPLGWLRHTFAHSHDPSEQVDSVLESSDRGIRALKISLVGLGITALLQLVIVLFSGSVALLADTIHNFGDASTAIPLWIAFALIKRGANRRFTYGYGRTEDIAGVIIVLLIFFSAVVAAYESIEKIISPRPVDNLWWVAAAAVIGFIGNEAVAQYRIRVGTQISSAALIADGQHSRVDGFTSLAVLIGVVGVAVGVPILDPIVGLIITVTILFIVKDAALSVFRRLLDAIEPDILSEVEHAPTHVLGVQDVHQARARWLGHKVYADLHFAVDPSLTVSESHQIADQVQQELADHIPALGGAHVHVCPGASSREPAEPELSGAVRS